MPYSVTDMDIINEKKLLRREMKALRKSIPPKEKVDLDKRICENLFSSEYYRNAQLILTFISVGDEPDTRNILLRAWKEGKLTAVPKCLPDHKMSFYIIESFDDCTEGAYGIPEPKSYCREAQLEGENILCLVPGLAFDREGARLGYGGGYYDRFLSCHTNIICMGLCAERFITAKVPEEETDIKLDGLITEKTAEVLYGKQ
ncbi:MAG: 5-formyltetrahydrofolate cyclo-ligase [Ruminococcus sp.]